MFTTKRKDKGRAEKYTLIAKWVYFVRLFVVYLRTYTCSGYSLARKLEENKEGFASDVQNEFISAASPWGPLYAEYDGMRRGTKRRRGR